MNEKRFLNVNIFIYLEIYIYITHVSFIQFIHFSYKIGILGRIVNVCYLCSILQATVSTNAFRNRGFSSITHSPKPAKYDRMCIVDI